MNINNFAGVWKLVSSEFERADGVKTYPYGDGAIGMLIYDEHGYISVHIMRPDRPIFASGDIRNGSPDEGVQIVVSDTGIGIDPKFHELIFTKFYQTGKVELHSSGKTKFKGGGPGLGLAIARGIVLAHGGRISVESSGHDESVCPGSRLIVMLPLTQKKAGVVDSA
jgi:signal transduction histidine kinase